MRPRRDSPRGERSISRIIKLSARARGDLNDIWAYGAAYWGVNQADRYARQLYADMELIPAKPALGPAFKSGGRLYRRWPSGRHRLYYRVEAEAVLVVRILHVRADASRHLPRFDKGAARR